MDKFPMCRICLVKNVPLNALVNKNLHELYEKLINKPFVTEDSTPNLVCYFCCAKLKQSYHLVKKCLGAKERFAQMMDENYKPQPLVNNGHLNYLNRFIRSSIQVISTVDKLPKETIVIKEELSEVCDNIIEPKKEILSDDDDNEEKYEVDIVPHTESHSDGDVPLLTVKIEVEVPKNEVTDVELNNLESANIHDSCPDAEDSGSDSEDVPLMIFKAEKTVEEQLEVSKNKRRSVETSRATVAKKPKLSAGRTKQEDTITAGLETNEHTGERPFKCDPCPSSFTQKSSLNNTGEKPHKCEICQKSYTKKSYLTAHVRIHTGEKPFKCDMCPRSFTQKCVLNKHIRTHTGVKPHKCDVCQHSFLQKSGLKRHMILHTGEKPHKCDICQQSFTEKGSLTAHVRIHTGEKPFKCDMCPRSFTQKSILKKHTRKHTGVKPHKCDVCQHSFFQKSDLKRHMTLHTGEKPHKCDICQQTFTEKGSLTAHVRIHTGEKPFKCNMCPLSFIYKSVLTKHIRTHTGEKPHKCHICERSFSETGHLKYHIRTHTGVKPYMCDICQKSFNQKSGLKRHIQSHTIREIS